MTAFALQPSFADLPDESETIGGRFTRVVEAAMNGDMSLVRQLSAEFARYYQGPDSVTVRGKIGHIVKRQSIPISTAGVERLPIDLKSRMPLIEEQMWPTTPLLLTPEQNDFLGRFILEASNAEKLARAGFSTRFNMLLSGPPGTGKSFLASHVAARLGLPFNVVRLDTMVSSLLGETAKNIRSIFDYALRSGGFLFIDEIDALAKRRDDEKELGELKRVVNTLIQGIDILDGKTIVIAATNHPHLLDPAIWRRFPYNLQMGLPGAELRSELWNLYLFEGKDVPRAGALARLSNGLSISDIREISLSAKRWAFLKDEDLQIDNILFSILDSTEGRIVMPRSSKLDRKAKSELEARLVETDLLTHEEVSILLQKSRQSVSANTTRRKSNSEPRKADVNLGDGTTTCNHQSRPEASNETDGSRRYRSRKRSV